MKQKEILKTYFLAPGNRKFDLLIKDLTDNFFFKLESKKILL